jgi:predicted  nucleic acid-binding Zn-ribbon protein
MLERSNSLARQVRDLETDLAQKEARIRDLGESAASLSRRVKELESSLSWRVTGPLRALGTVVLRLRAFLAKS